MTSLLENPLPTAVGGVMVVAVLGIIWINTGHKAVLYALLGAIGLFGALILLEKFVVTDREKIESAIRTIEVALEEDDANTVVSYIARDKTKIQQDARQYLATYVIESLNVSQLEIEVDPDNLPPIATAKFAVTVRGSRRDGAITNQAYPFSLVVTFRKQDDDQWRIDGYELKPYQDAFKKPQQ